MNREPASDRVNEFLTLLSGCERRVYGYILALVQHFHDADDIAQETRTRLWQQFETYEPGTSFEAWARTIAYYQVLTYREKESRQRLRFGSELLDQISEEYDAGVEYFERRQAALLACLEAVSQGVRRLLQLVYAQGLSVKQAAQQLNRSIEGTYKALSRARQGLHDCIERKLRGGEV